MRFFKDIFGKKTDTGIVQQKLKRKTLLDDSGPGTPLFEVLTVFNFPVVGTIAVGIVVSGKLVVGLSTTINGKVGEITSIEENQQNLSKAVKGNSVGIYQPFRKSVLNQWFKRTHFGTAFL